jgi:hypothetical protein
MRPRGVDRLAASTKVALFVLPPIAGMASGFAVASGVNLSDGLSQMLAASALLVGAMISCFVFLTNLRVKVSESATYAFRVNMQRLIGGSAVGCLYVAVVALIFAGQIATVASVQALRSEHVAPFTVALLTATLAHLVMTLLSVIRRLFGVYVEFFASDFNPEQSASVVSSTREADRVSP